MNPGPGEPITDLWRAGEIDDLARDLLGTAAAGRPHIVGHDAEGSLLVAEDRPR